MQSFMGTYGKTFFRDEKTGYTSFSVFTKDNVPKNEYNVVLCTGIIPVYPVNIPLELTGHFETKQGYRTFIVSSCKNKSNSESVTISFLASNTFDGIGEKTAKNIVKYAGNDIFDFVNREDAETLLVKNVKGLSAELAKKFVSKIKGLSALEDLINYVVSMGGCYEDAVHIYEKYGAMSTATMQKNPYMLRYAGAKYETCEAIAKKRNWEACDPRRVLALVEECMDRNDSNGNTIISFRDLYKNIKRLEDNANMGYHTNPLFIIKALFNTKYTMENIGGVLYVSFKEIHDAETTIVTELKRLEQSKTELSHQKYNIQQIEDMCGITYEERQKDAFSAIDYTGVKIITGGPGTGKSTTLNGLLKKYELENPNKKIVLCAPTGRAAKRMEESTGRSAQTIHRLLQIRPFGEDMKCKDAYDQLDADCIIIDEMSMVATKLFAILLKAIKNNTLLILVGDKDQLPSVGAGNILRDLLKNGQIETYYLKESFRHLGKNELLKNAVKIRDGNIDLLEDDSFEIRRFHSDSEMKTAAVELMKDMYDENNPSDTRLFTPVRKRTYSVGSIMLNRELKDYINPTKGESLTYGGYTFSEGDLVILTANNYQKGYFNGDEGTIIDIQIHTYHKYMTIQMDDKTVTLTGKELADVELAYTLTAHKSQGGECENAIILIPKTPKALLIRSLVYVEATRAKKKNIFLVEGDALEYAIRNAYHKERITGLEYRLRS